MKQVIWTLLSMNIPWLNKSNINLVALAGVGFGVAFLFNGSAGASAINFKFSGDAMNLIAVVGGVIGGWQVISSMIDGIQKESTARDRYHDEQISGIKSQIEGMASQLEHHVSQLGHDGTINRVMDLQKEVADCRSALSGLSLQGEFALKLEELELQMQEIIKDRLHTSPNPGV